MQTLDSNAARLHWREIMDRTIAGEDTVITRYGKPVAAVIPFADYEAIRPALDALRRARLTDEADAAKARSET